MTLPLRHVQYPVGEGQTLVIPFPSLPLGFSPYDNITNPVRLKVAGIGYLDFPAGVDVWTDHGYVAVESSVGYYLEFAPTFTWWDSSTGTPISSTSVLAAITRARILSVATLSGVMTRALPSYVGTFLQLASLTRSHVNTGVGNIDFSNTNAGPITVMVAVTAEQVEALTNFNIFSPTTDVTDALVQAFLVALTTGDILNIVYNADALPYIVTGESNGESYTVTYAYTTYDGVSQPSLLLGSYLGHNFQKVFTYSGLDVIHVQGWELVP